MAFQTKTDYCGLATAASASIAVKSDSEGLSAQKYQPQGQDGSFVATEVYGVSRAPSNDYALIANLSATAGQIKLGKITSVTIDSASVPFALESISITTNAGSAPSISASAKQVESGAADSSMCHYSIPAFTLTTKHHAQDIFSAMTLTGEGCHITECSASISCTVNVDSNAGAAVGSDVNSGLISVTASILQTGATAPSVAAASGWTISAPLACENPETEYKRYTITLEKPLAKDVVSAS